MMELFPSLPLSSPLPSERRCLKWQWLRLLGCKLQASSSKPEQRLSVVLPVSLPSSLLHASVAKDDFSPKINVQSNA